MAWWLLYEELYGDMDKEYPIMTKDDVTNVGGDSDDTITFTSDGVGAADTVNIGSPIFGSASPDTIDFGGSHLKGGMGSDHISYASTDFAVDDVYSYHYPPTNNRNYSWEDIEKPKPDLKDGSTHKYQEDKGIADLKSYVASTYQGHYTNKNSDVQTLDLIHSVGDAESFCRSNAIKYLSRYDKKGSAKNDILKAMHYCLLLYYFSGNTQEPDYTNTRYETF